MNTLSARQYMQYSSNILLHDIGEAGQLAIMNSHVVIVGLGGLGQLVAQYLAAAGVKSMTLIDNDVVALSNLPRQLLYVDSDLGELKVNVAKRALAKANSNIKLTVFAHRLTHQHLDVWARRLMTAAVVFDCTDNIETRQLINQICVAHKLTLVSGAISAYQGQVFCIDFNHNQCGCYRCLYPADIHLAQHCAQQGVLGPAVGVVASLQALFGVQHITNTFKAYGKLHRFDAQAFVWQSAQMVRDPDCEVCTATQQHLARENHDDNS
ncbi:HesA/MoeB/ThiF family protein [Shewanella inventionis]|uniref:Thiamine biosynthesis protein ThiF n=1 Tax=Shewanella inventionis TaxID=1738770 RepID=A0ABQ1IQZ1_9GAMM|nr:HesA/MoeB/ThiF family protein [Shewanella inventionis]MCL1157214.1 HesA/MoeB/ThiF family protein [Shewanella inventionis]GGB48976.1 thiamine biosynthesis protein ThiF [Shewanella inventionis]